MKSIGFEILLDDAKLKGSVAALKKELGSIGGSAKDIKVKLDRADMAKLRKELRDSLAVKLNIGITDAKLKNLKKVGTELNSGIVEAGRNMEVFLVKLREAEKLSKKVGRNMGGVGGGGVSNGGSRTGFGDPTGSRSLLSAFSGFIRGGQSYTSQVGALASGLGMLGLAYGLPIAAAASFVRGLGIAVEQIKEFGARNAELAAVLATSRDGIGDLTEQAVELGSEMAFTAAEISGAQVELAKLGFNKEEIISATESVARFAIVTGSKIPEAAEAAGAAMLSFGLEATEMDRVTSVLGVGTAKTALDFEKLKVGIGTTFATAKTFGLEIEDVTALLGELSNKGLSGGVAATATRNILLNLANDGGKLRKTLAGLGVKEVKGLDGIVVALRKLDAAGIDLATTFELTDKRSVNAFNTFLRGSGDLNKLRDSLVDVSDQAKVMEKERLNSLEGATILYASAVERLNLTLGGAGGLEGILQSVVLQAAELLNSFADLVALDPGEAVRNEADAVVGLIKSLIDANDNSALRNKLIAELKLSYPEVIKNINLEKATTSELNKLLNDTLLLYDKKINISIGETEFEKAIKRENEALEKQAKLLKRSKEDDVIFQRAFNPAINKAGGEASKAREEAFLGLTTGIASTGFASVEQEKYLRDILKQNPSRRGGALSGDAKTANTILQQIGFLRNTVAKDVPTFKKEDFAIPDDGQLSKVEKYLKQLEDQRDLFKSNSVQADELSKAIKSVEKQIEDRRSKGNVQVIGGKKKGGGGSTAKGKEDPLAGSIDELEKIYNDLYKQIEATGIESERYTYQKKAELAKKALDEAREKVKANAALTSEEELKIFKNGIDNKVTAYNEYAKIIIKDEETLNEVIKVNKLKGDLEILQREEADLQKLSDKKLDKTNELAKKQIEIELKKKEIIEGTERVNIETREALAEDELKRNVENAEKIIKNEEDRATYIELLYLKLSKFKLENEKKVGKELNDEQVKQLAELEKQIQERVFLLGGGGPNLTPQDANTSGKGTKTSDIKGKFIGSALDLGKNLLEGELSEEEFQKYQDSIKQIEFEKNLALLEDEKSRIKAGTQAAIEAEYEIQQLKIDNQKYLHEKKQADADKEKDKMTKIYEQIGEAAGYIGQVLGELFDYQRDEIDYRLDSELTSLDTIYQARLEAAKGNEAETERIEKEYEAKKKAANKKAAEERKQIALKEAYIQLALGVIEAIPNLAAMAVAAVVGGIQIAAIQKQKFAGGGFTPRGNGQVDETGRTPVGIVHQDEYVAPTKQIRKYPGLFNFLDQDRRKFASGGFTSGATSGMLGVQISEQQIMAMAEMIASRTADSVGAAAYSATYGGTKNGAKDGIVKVNRENASRKDSLKVNTF